VVVVRLAVPVAPATGPARKVAEPGVPETGPFPKDVPPLKNVTVPVGPLPKLGSADVPRATFAVSVTLPPVGMLVALGVTATELAALETVNASALDVLALKLASLL